jgi:hypothetical protein
LEAFRQAQVEKRGETYEEFIKEWDAQKAEKVWDRLRRLINTPIDLETALRAAQSDSSTELVPPQM